MVSLAYDHMLQRYVVIKEALDNNVQLINEIRFVSQLSHESIINPIEVDPDGRWIVLPYAEGGDLMDYLIRTEGPLSEDVARLAFRKILEALVYLYNNGIVHRDIKPEQFFINGPTFTGDNILLGDFGLACCAEYRNRNDVCGTPGYIAPEVYRKGEYTHKSDVWALGMSMLVALSGKWPFASSSAGGIEFEVMMGATLNSDDVFEGLSEDAVDLIKQMLEPDPLRRLTAAEALNHPWFQSPDLTPEPLSIAKESDSSSTDDKPDSSSCDSSSHNCFGSASHMR